MAFCGAGRAVLQLLPCLRLDGSPKAEDEVVADHSWDSDSPGQAFPKRKEVVI